MQITSASYVWPSSHLLFFWSRGNIPTDEGGTDFTTRKSLLQQQQRGLNIQVTHEQTWRSISSAFYSQVNRKKTFHPKVHPDIDQKEKKSIRACVSASHD